MKELPSYAEWIEWLSVRSLNFEAYGSFLPEQEELFRELHRKLAIETKKVWTFSAPTASGKSHVILLLADFLGQENSVAVIVPNNYLKVETIFRKNLISNDKINGVDVLSLHEYIITNSYYDFVLVDEAHNLRTSLELDTRIVKTFRIFEADEFFEYLADRFLPPGAQYNAQKLSTSDSRFVLGILLKRFPSSRKIWKNLTAWASFVYISDECCEMKFVRVSGLWSFRLPRKKLILFSATPLSMEELTFYCGIDQSMIEASVAIAAISPRRRQRIYYSVTDALTDKLKLRYLCNLLSHYPKRSLVLFNNSVSCQKAYKYLSTHLRKTRTFHISSYEESKRRMETYSEYLRNEDGVLLSSSNIFWEGISVENLDLLVIMDVPYPRPTLYELSSGRREGVKRLISRRLEQGLGRISRTGKVGICILLFDVEHAVRGMVEGLNPESRKALHRAAFSEVLKAIEISDSPE